MKKSILCLFVFLIGLSGCHSEKAVVSVVNYESFDLKEYAVILSRQQVQEKFKKSIDGLLVYAMLDGQPVSSQCDDLDGDGVWDELVFLADLSAGENHQYDLIDVEAGKFPVFPKRTNIRFGRAKSPYQEVEVDMRLKSTDSPTISGVYQMEGPAWENDLVGFRNYYDARNGIDIFGKKSESMVLDSAGIRGRSYHEMDEWGMDILKVANSLGAGAIALAHGDSLYRVGPCEKGTYRFVTEGPVRAIFEFDFLGVPVGDTICTIHQEIKIYAGDHFYCSSTWISGLEGDRKLVTGIVNKHSCPLVVDSLKTMKLFFTHGPQAYTNEFLGLGLLVHDSDLVKYETSPMTGDGITETYLVYLQADNQPVRHYFFSGWEFQDAGFKDPSFLLDQLQLAAGKIAARIKVN